MTAPSRHHMLLLASRVATIDADVLTYAWPRTPEMEAQASELYDVARRMIDDAERATRLACPTVHSFELEELDAKDPVSTLWEEAMAWFHRSYS